MSYTAVRFLVQNPDDKILDIGSGSGKFCLIGAYYKASAHFFGIEQREYLVKHAKRISTILGLRNTTFLHGNFTDIDLSQYTGFYFYNSFFEHLASVGRIDDHISFSRDLYDSYSAQLHKKLHSLPAGARIATYCSWGDEIPPDYALKESHFDGLLKCWEKAGQ